MEQKIGIFGLGKTGISIFNDLKNNHKNLICWDDNEKNRTEFVSTHGEANIIDLKSAAWQTAKAIAISPGVPFNHPIFLLAKRYNILIFSDIQMFLEKNRQSKIISITGTNGKSTAASLCHHILQKNNLNYELGGNIGTPALALKNGSDGYVLELSSFQLNLLDNFTPDISVLINITEDHLQAHGGFENYCNAKFKALKGDGVKIIGTNTKICADFYSKLKKNGDKKIIAIGVEFKDSAIYIENNMLCDNYFDHTSHEINIPQALQGTHNSQNIAACYAICRASGLRPDEILNNIQDFQGLKHRFQYIGTKNSVAYYNDSKATNSDACAKSLSSENNIFWIAGGLFKETNLDALNDILRKNSVEKAYLFGKDASILAKHLKNMLEYAIFENLEQAYSSAQADAEKFSAKNAKRSCVILAPACASFDQYKNFEDRGEDFINLYEKE